MIFRVLFFVLAFLFAPCVSFMHVFADKFADTEAIEINIIRMVV